MPSTSSGPRKKSVYIPISAMEDIDDEVKDWLKVAYDRDA